MAGKQELDAAIAGVITSLTNEVSIVQTETQNVIGIIAEMTNAFSRLLQKIAEGSPDLQGSIDQINGMKTNLDAAAETLNTANDSLVSAIAQAKVEGV